MAAALRLAGITAFLRTATRAAAAVIALRRTTVVSTARRARHAAALRAAAAIATAAVNSEHPVEQVEAEALGAKAKAEHQRRCNRNGGMFRIAPGGKGVGHRAVDQVNARHRHLRLCR